MAEGELIIEVIDSKLDAHNATRPHESHEGCQAAIAALEARIAKLETGEHRHESTEDYVVEEIEA